MHSFLWDLGLKVGHAAPHARSPNAWSRGAEERHLIRTALLDGHPVASEANLIQRLPRELPRPAFLKAQAASYHRPPKQAEAATIHATPVLPRRAARPSLQPRPSRKAAASCTRPASRCMLDRQLCVRH